MLIACVSPELADMYTGKDADSCIVQGTERNDNAE